MPIELSTDQSPEPVASSDTVIACLTQLNSQAGAEPVAADQACGDLDGQPMPLSRVAELAAAFGFSAQWNQLDWTWLKATGFTDPILVLRKDNDAVIVTAGGRAGAEEVSVWDPHHDGVVFFVPREDFERHWSGHALIMSPSRALDTGGAALPRAAGAMKEVQPETEATVSALPSSRDAASPGLSRGLSVLIGSVVLTAICGVGAYYVVVNREAPAATGAATIASTRSPPDVAAPPGALEPAASALPTQPENSVPSAAEIATLSARGDALFRSGDLAAARLFYQRAADAGDGQAAIRLGETFDPVFLEHAQLRGARGDLELALSWYRRARDLGVTEAGLLLRSLEDQKSSDRP
jgi:hypothetical protein